MLQIRLAVGQKDEQDQTTFNDLLDGNGRGHRWVRHCPSKDADRVALVREAFLNGGGCCMNRRV